MKNLGEYIEAIADNIIEEFCNVDFAVNKVVCDSRVVTANDIFVAIEGAEFDGHNYIDNAISKGAKTIVHTANICRVENINYIKVLDSYKAYSYLSECYFDYPSRNFMLAGITGTNGKTTTAFLLKDILSSAGQVTGLISTVEYSFGDKAEVASRTTPEANELQRLFSEMSVAGCESVVMEVSSHGLDQNRTASARFKAAVFTNLTGDHLDYHITMDNYFKAKEHLFVDLLEEGGSAVINIDDPYGARIADACGRQVVTYGKAPSSLCRIKNVDSTVDGSIIDIEFDGKELTLYTSMIGYYNAYNICAATLAAYSLGVDIEVIKQYFCRGSAQNVPGRMEAFRTKQGSSVFVDYAHTDDALSNVLSTLQPLTRERLIVVVGCGGDRDVTKRPRMGAVATSIADIVIFTSDNPRSERPSEIIRQMMCGVTEYSKVTIVEDRAEAIAKAMEISSEGDVVLITGKGHESYQEIEGVFYDFDDRQIISSLCSQ